MKSILHPTKSTVSVKTNVPQYEVNMSHESVVFNGYTVLSLKINKDSKCLHYLYVKDHSVRDLSNTKPKNRTLFVLNIPPYCESKHIEHLFSSAGFGKVTNVFLHNKPTVGDVPKETSKFFPSTPPLKGYKVAYVVFDKEEAIRKVKSWPYDKHLILQDKGAPPLRTGMRKWCQDYEKDTVNVTELQKEVDEHMEEFDRKMEEEARKAKEQEGVPDEDGWVKVTKFSKRSAPRTEAHETALTQKENKRGKEKELVNFYRFQIRESKREHIASLRKKFEEDKQRIALMKASRKFRPY